MFESTAVLDRPVQVIFTRDGTECVYGSDLRGEIHYQKIGYPVTDHTIRKAVPEECALLTEIAFSSKRYWQYPDEYFDVWRSELTVTGQYLHDNHVYVYEKSGTVCAFYSLVLLPNDLTFKGEVLEKGVWLDHMFVHPAVIGQGIGRTLFNHCSEVMKENGWQQCSILSDPHAKDFYLNLGCEYLREIPSTIEGRTTPLLTFTMSG